MKVFIFCTIVMFSSFTTSAFADICVTCKVGERTFAVSGKDLNAAIEACFDRDESAVVMRGSDRICHDI